MATANQVSQLFVALYNRAIDGVTAQQYGGRAYNQSFISEVIGLTPNLRTMTNQEFVELVYKNALGKDNNSDKAGIDYWVTQANTNNWRREQLTDNLLRSINAWADQNADTTNLTPDQITLASQGATVFRTKVAIAEQAATTVGGQADAYALTFGSGLEEVTFLNYNTARENNTKILQGIAARNPLAQSGGANITLNLDTTIGQDSFLEAGNINIPPAGTASGAYVYQTSTDFDDTITASVVSTPNESTFTPTTQINAGKGNDVLKVDMGASFTGLSGDGKVTGVERIELTNTTVNDNVTFNASGIRDVYTYVLNGANGINLTNIAYNEYLLIEMNNIKSTGNTTGSSGAATVNNGGVTQITFDTTPTGGRLDLNFNGVGYDSTDNKISNHDILFGIGSGSAIDPSGSADDFANQAAGIGILNIALTGNNYADIVNTGVNRITVGGNGSLTTNLSKGVTYFNGANATGSLNITATDKKETGENGTNIFEYFATGSAADKVHIAVERLGQNATVNLGLGDDTLILSGEVDHEARKQFYNFNTIENLVFQNLTGDSLLVDLGTTIVTTPQDPIVSGSGSKKTEIPQDPIITTTQDRSANLQTITFEDGASVQLTSLGKKDLKVTYNGATDTQKVLVDTTGTVDLVLQGSDGGTAGTGKIGAGFVNLSNASKVNVDLTGQGFEGYLSAGNATDLNIKNYTGDKKLTLKANTLTEKNDLSSVVNLTIDSEAQNHGTTTSTIDLSTAGFASLANVVLKGIGDIVFGDINTSATSVIAFNGNAYSGHLHTGNLYAGDQTIRITTKGAITTGNLAASHIDIDLSKNITTTEGQYNNNIGTIILTPNFKNEVATLNYTTGISGTRGHQTDTQQIHVNANRANMILNGAGGSDKFHITASSFTKEIVLSGHLGNSRENQSDFVFIDLRQTNGCNVDMQDLVVNNSDNGVYITASKGQDSISLLANQNHDKISFNAGGPATAQPEKYSLNLAGTKLEKFQSFTLEGLTLTSLYVDGSIDAQELTNALYTHITQGEDAFKQTQSSIIKDQTTNTYYTYGELFNTQGSFNGLENQQGWEYNPQLIEKTDATTIKITSSEKSDVPDLKLNWEGNENTHAAFDYYDEENSNKQKAWHHVNSANAKLVDTTGATLTGIQTINDIIGMAKNKTITTNEEGYRSGYTYGDNLFFANLYASFTTPNIQNAQAMKDVLIASVDIIGNDSATYTFAAIGNGGYSRYASEVVATVGGYYTRTYYASYIPFSHFTSNLKNLLEGQSIGTSHSVDFVVWKDGVKTDIKDSLVGKKFLDAVTFTNPTSNNLQFSLTNPKYEITKPSFKPDDLDRTYQTESIKIGNTTVKLEEYHPIEHIDPIPAKITIDFQEGLNIGEHYQFAGKYVFATENLSGEEIAKAFKGEDVSGAMVLGKWYQEFDSAGTMVAGIDANNVAFSVNGSTLTLVDRQSGAPLNNGIPLGIKGMETDAQFMNALKVTGGANPPKVTIKTTTKQGQDQETICADSYVNLTLSVAGNSSTKTEFVKNIDELGTLSSISNFELGIDKLTLYQFADDVQIDYQGELFEATHRASQSDLRITDRVYIDENGTTLQANIDAQGLIEFSHEASIESKAYLLRNIAQNKLAGFAHEEDFYVLASGNNPNATTDDLLIKLTGLGSMVLDVAMLLG